jgi:Pyruvate/2-oxoacid:ferredoxin oxidoreductase delta subunit
MTMRKLLLCLFITIALASQGIAGAVMSVQMAGVVSSHGDMRTATAHLATSAPDHESHFKCAACLFFCSGVSTPYDTSSVAHGHITFDVPMWVTPNLQDVPPSGLFRPPQPLLA